MSSLDSSIDQQLQAGLKAHERRDSVAFDYNGVKAIGVLGVPSLEATLSQSGPLERYNATLTVRRGWFNAPPSARDGELLAVFSITSRQRRTALATCQVPAAVFACNPTRRYLVTGINLEDPLAYEFQLLDR